MIYRKKMKVGEVDITYKNEIFTLSKDSKKLKKRISDLISEILEKNKIYKNLKITLNHYDNLPKIVKLWKNKSMIKYEFDQAKAERQKLIDDLRSFGCFACPISRVMYKLDIDSRIQDLYSFIALKQTELLNTLGEKNNCEIEQEFDPSRGDKYIGNLIYHNCTGVGMKDKTFDENNIIYTESDFPINRTEDDILNNKDYIQLETLNPSKHTGEGIYTTEEKMNAHYI